MIAEQVIGQDNQGARDRLGILVTELAERVKPIDHYLLGADVPGERDEIAGTDFRGRNGERSD